MSCQACAANYPEYLRCSKDFKKLPGSAFKYKRVDRQKLNRFVMENYCSLAEIRIERKRKRSLRRDSERRDSGNRGLRRKGEKLLLRS